MKKILSKLRSISLDTNVFVYYLDRESPFYSRAEGLFRQIADQNLPIFTSVMTLAELLSFKAPGPQLDKLEQELLLIPNLTMIDVNHQIAKDAARIRRNYGFRLPDSVQLATALFSRTQVFVSNDVKLAQFKELRVVLLKQT